MHIYVSTLSGAIMGTFQLFNYLVQPAAKSASDVQLAAICGLWAEWGVWGLLSQPWYGNVKSAWTDCIWVLKAGNLLHRIVKADKLIWFYYSKCEQFHQLLGSKCSYHFAVCWQKHAFLSCFICIIGLSSLAAYFPSTQHIVYWKQNTKHFHIKLAAESHFLSFSGWHLTVERPLFSPISTSQSNGHFSWHR